MLTKLDIKGYLKVTLKLTIIFLLLVAVLTFIEKAIEENEVKIEQVEVE